MGPNPGLNRIAANVVAVAAAGAIHGPAAGPSSSPDAHLNAVGTLFRLAENADIAGTSASGAVLPLFLLMVPGSPSQVREGAARVLAGLSLHGHVPGDALRRAGMVLGVTLH
jgi:hypothetical protein